MLASGRGGPRSMGSLVHQVDKKSPSILITPGSGLVLGCDYEFPPGSGTMCSRLHGFARPSLPRQARPSSAAAGSPPGAQAAEYTELSGRSFTRGCQDQAEAPG